MMLKLAVLSVVSALCLAGPPNVQVYTYRPIREGESNVLFCHAKDFSPPNIKLELLENENVIPNANQSDLSFEADWSFKLTKFVEITPKNGVKYVCRVEHNGVSKVIQLDSY
ncbi:beta-2-microglobulin-like [Carcharodon carcharias]|uniref:beta-2-microglobulin-like n=1 Tax=Carcharodon carcharias TaxID=13397 RepID=UPI001B7F2FDB|nr:beta-2-microglobulin-like [Carcharodon carcharias]